MACGGSITLNETGARRTLRALVLADGLLCQIERVRAHPMAADAREARIEIGTAIAHLRAALPSAPVASDEVAP